MVWIGKMLCGKVRFGQDFQGEVLHWECSQCRPKNQIYAGADEDGCHCPYPKQGLHCGKKPRARFWDAILANIYENSADASLKSATMTSDLKL